MASDSYNITGTVLGWTAVVGVAGLYYYTRARRNSAPPPTRRGGPVHAADPRKEKNAKNKRRDAFLSDAQDYTGPSKKANEGENKWLSNVPDSSDNDVDNREFARQLANVREGTKFTAKSGGEKKRQKSVKQSQAAKASDFDDEKVISAPSSTTGVDADDDQSPTMSPEVTAADAGDVSDMLEAPAPGPSVLRIVDTDKVKQPQPKKAKTPEPVETKKQRENRKKREKEKELRAELEVERKKKEEQQRRTARIARGEPAKDGSQFMARVNGNGNKPSAWQAGAPGSKPAPVATDGFLPVQPLDTYEPAPVTTSSSTSFSNELSQPLASSWIEDLPSEEEQLQKLKEETEEWSTVKTKSSKRSIKKEPSSDLADHTDKVETAAPVAAPTAAAAPKAQNGKAPAPPKSFGSFSALSTNEVEEEKEWEL